MPTLSIREAATAVVLLTPLTFAACASDTLAPSGTTTPVYNKTTGRLEQIVSDRNRDGRVETRAFMDGAQLQRIEIDRNGDGQPDRWEYYLPTPAALNVAPDSQPAQIERAEEANGKTNAVTRREFYANGVLAKVEEDTDADGRVDKWEHYEGGILRQVELDLQGKGFPDRRLIYGAAGEMARVEVDTTGSGTFVALASTVAGGAR
jgi:hypothetical protein